MTTDGTSSAPMTTVGRERALTDMFVLLADTLVDDYDVVDLLDRLVTACVDVLDVTAAGLLLDDQRGSLTVVASSSEQTRLLEVFQLQTNEGPCLDCVASGAPVTVADLAAERERWPRFVPAALDIGFRSVAAFPLRLRSQRIGGLNLFDSHPREVAPDDRRIAQALADVATIGILQRRSVHRSSMMAEQLQHVLNSRVSIEQAKGVVAERGGVDMETAFAALRGYARRRNLKLTDVALGVIRGTIGPEAFGDPPEKDTP